MGSDLDKSTSIFLSACAVSAENHLTLFFLSLGGGESAKQLVEESLNEVDGIQHAFFATVSELPPESIFRNYANTKPSRAVLVVDATDPEATRSIIGWIQTPLLIPLVAAQLRDSKRLDRSDRHLEILALCQFLALVHRWQVLVLLDKKEMDNAGKVTKSDQATKPQSTGEKVNAVPLSKTDLWELYWFRISGLDLRSQKDPNHAFQKRMNTKQITRELGMIAGELARGNRLIAERTTNTKQDQPIRLHLPETKDVLSEWEDREFELDEARHAFSKIVDKFSHAYPQDLKFQCKRVLLSAASVARRSATRAFEGRPCNINFVLISPDFKKRTPKDHNENIADKVGFENAADQGEPKSIESIAQSRAYLRKDARIIFTYSESVLKLYLHELATKLDDNCNSEALTQSPLATMNENRRGRSCCHPADTSFVHDQIELGQSEELFYVIEAETGQLLSIETVCPTFKDKDSSSSLESRHERLARLTNHSSAMSQIIVMSVLPPGYVEVYFEGQFKLWHNRSRWKSEPFYLLQSSLESYLEKVDMNLWDRPTTIRSACSKLIGAIGSLMDGWHSSILVFSDRKTFADLDEDGRPSQMLSRLRNPPPILSKNLPITELPLDALVSLLRLDGAHFFDGFELVEVSRRIVVDKGQKNEAGTGRAAAKALADQIVLPGFVLKVSASGDLKIYPGKKPHG